MAITEHKISSWTNPVSGEDDRPNRTAAALKAVFDSNSNQLKTALNDSLDELGAWETKVSMLEYDAGNHSDYLCKDGTYSSPATTAGNVPSGGTTGAVLVKTSDVDYATGWTDIYSTQTVTLSAAGWSGKQQTVSVTGATATNAIFVSAAPASYGNFGKYGVYAYSQSTGTITFKCARTPTVDIDVNLVLMGVDYDS